MNESAGQNARRNVETPRRRVAAAAPPVEFDTASTGAVNHRQLSLIEIQFRLTDDYLAAAKSTALPLVSK